ncbi:MAG: hypothetical protein PHY45_11545 [Rhodocyclaceae bacterium]|nr:hypothetical protein [Rhodocyclaceae bacterium]
MATRHVLLLDADGLTAYRCRDGAAACAGRFAAADAAAFRAYLKQCPDDVYHLLADVADESFQLEHIPHVTGRSRRALIARKLDQHCQGTPLAVALPQGRLADGRRDERMLFAALTRPQDVEPWLPLLEQLEIALAGIYSMPQVLAALPPARAAAPLLLLTLARGGLRQTLLEDGRLRFSRLTPLADDDIDKAAAACAGEAAKIHRYLCGQKLVDRDAPLTALVLAHPAQLEAFRRHCRDGDELRFDYLDLAAEARRRGLTTPLPDSHGDAFFAHLLIADRPRRQFAPAAARRFYRLRQVRRALDRSGLAAFAAALLFAALQLPDAVRMRQHAAQLQAQNEVAERGYRDAQQALPPSALPAERLREVVGRYEQLLRAAPGPAPLFGRLGAALDDFPQIELQRLEWRLAQEVGQAAAPAASVDVHGALLPGIDRHRQLAVVDGFADRLRSDPALQVRILKLPFAIESSKPLKSTDGADAAQEPALFVLRVTQKS